MHPITVRRLVVSCAGLFAATALAVPLTPVPNANNKIVGQSAPNGLSPELTEAVVAEGSNRLENPAAVTVSGGGTVALPYYGYNGDWPFVPALGSNVEATKTEPDKNTYLAFQQGLSGPDAGYDYGTHFLFQGHELGAPGYITRINLDADGAHRVTLMSTKTDAGVDLKTIDGSMWNPFTQKLLYTTESGSISSIYEATPGYPSHVVDVSNVFGRGAFEGVQADDRGNLYLAEDAGGKVGAVSGDTTSKNAFTKQPNSFIYRFVPNDPSDLSKGGKMQVLQVLVNGQPLKFTKPLDPSSAQSVADAANTDISGTNSDGYVKLHQYGTSYATKWITINTTTSSTALPGIDDNAAAKTAGGTPFKRPENGVFRPGSRFKELYFDETGDTDNRTCAGSVSTQPSCTTPNPTGGFGSLFRLVQSPTSDDGTITVLYNGDQTHAGFDNTAFVSSDQIVFVEDAGDTLHTERNALDSAWLFDVNADYAHGAQPTRIIAEGRDASATIDSGLSGSSGFQNEGDNEITGFYVSNGDTSTRGLLGRDDPRLFRRDGSWRAFWTQQHGDNNTWELIAAPGGQPGPSDDEDD